MKILIETIRIAVILAIFTMGIVGIAVLTMQTPAASSGIDY
ncbi:MAG: hypothetical protein WC856_02095 [Methylococcaceae bacterium]|jgi:hypothetical protein